MTELNGDSLDEVCGGLTFLNTPHIVVAGAYAGVTLAGAAFAAGYSVGVAFNAVYSSASSALGGSGSLGADLYNRFN